MFNFLKTNIDLSLLEQICLRCMLTIERLNKILDDFANREKNEQLITLEIETFIKEKISCNDRAIKYWQQRYDEEMQMYKTKNGTLEEGLKAKQETLKQLETTYADRQAFIDKYLKEKELNRIQREREEYKQKCIIKIQSWWRGTMVRKKLGPYRLDDKKKKRPNKPKK
ncbi:dynein regulatory complex protein 9 [Chelonus insularis]|uniref:dynein regulatory complex protein 9 n=1 Tax=Chelonus insularis TaxID=460826 RepID=UPI001589FCE0|nr:dynein regulatory complex protein 9 [Chelonus insularis]